MLQPQLTIAMSQPKLDIRHLAEQHYNAVFAFCARRVGPELAQDAAQETFITAQSALGKFRGEGEPLAWLYGIAHNQCRRTFRQSKLQPGQIDLLDIEMSSPGASIVERQALNHALKSLSPEMREVVILHEIEGLKYKEIAQVLGIPIGTVQSRLHHAFINLRKALEN